MDIIQMTRELGKALQQDDRYIAYCLAKQANDADEKLQELIKNFSEKQAEISRELSEKGGDSDRIDTLNSELEECYRKIMSNKNMMVFNATKNAIDALVKNIGEIIVMCASGEDPDTCQPSTGCTGSCSTCGGCG